MQKNWIPIPAPEAAIVNQLANDLNIEPLVAGLLVQRGIHTFEEARAFFRPSLENLYDPFLMRDMDRAVARLEKALENGEKILVYGDYDVDGTTAVTIMYSYLRDLGVSCDYYIPDRYTEGYGFSMKGVDYAHEHGCSLIITLDCGVRDGAKIDYAAGKGIDVIVCDHHQPAQIPNASAVLDPKRPDCDYPFKGLCGAGVGFKLLQALTIRQNLDWNKLFQHLDLLTIAIAADIVPVSGENRILAYHGLIRLQNTTRPGISAMLKNAGFKKDQLTITDVVFILAPRINAAGRIFSGKKAVDLLLAQSPDDASPVAAAIEEFNTTRKNLDKGITEEALQKVKEDPFYVAALSIVVAGENWHKGVVGIVAARLVETHYKPTIVLVSDGEKMAGSARSIAGIDLFECLSECDDLLEQFGGHTMAAGLSLKATNFERFRKRFDEVIQKKLNHIKPVPQLHYDAEIAFTEIRPKLMRIIKQFEPFGPDNMHPIFLSEKVENHRFTRTVGDLKNHLKLHVHQQDTPSLALDGIGFDLGNWEQHFQQQHRADLLYTLEENTWNNKTTIQLVVKDIRAAE